MIQYSDILKILPDHHEYDGYITTRCPFHSDSSPSLLVYKDGWFRCLGCSRQGTWKTLWNRVKGQPIMPAVERKTRWGMPAVDRGNLEDVCFTAHSNLLDFPTLGWYLEMRGLEDCIEANEIGYWKGWYTIPVRDSDRNFVTAVFRAAPHVQEATGLRYWSPSEPRIHSPNWRQVETGKYIVAVFGIFDAMIVSSLGHPCITPISGMFNIKPEWLDEYRKMVYVIPDEGEERAALRLAGGLGWRGKVHKLAYPQGIKDPAGFAEKGKLAELRSQLAQLGGR